MSGNTPSYISSYTVYNSAALIRGGAEYFKKLEEIIDSAAHTIHLQTYIYDPDETGERIANALIRAVKRNVKVYVMVDAFASQRLSHAIAPRMREAGVHFNFFEPFFRTRIFYIGRRLHCKVIVADAYKCMIGGVNISDRYNDTHQAPAWLDWAIYVEGQVAGQVHDHCVRQWNVQTPHDSITGNVPPILPDTNKECLVRVRKNDWVKSITEITKSYRDMLVRADRHIIIMTSYFWPKRRILKLLSKASNRGVRIKLILAGPSDVMIAKYAERYLYNRLFKNNIEIYEYQDNILHGKLATYDSKWVTVGSYNVNNISSNVSVELNLDVKDTSFAIATEARLDAIIRNSCIKISPEEYTAIYSRWQRFVHALSYRVIHWVVYLFTFYYKQTTIDG